MASLSERLDAVDRHLQQEQSREAEALCRELLYTPCTLPEKALILDRLGQALHGQDRLSDARDALEESLALLRQTIGVHPVLAAVLQHLSRVCVSMQDLQTAYAHGNEALSMFLSLYGPEHPQVAAARFGLSFVAYNARKYDEAEALSLEAMRLWTQHFGPKSVEIATCLNNLGRIYEERGDFTTGISYHRQSVAMRKELLGLHPETGFALGNLGTALASAEQFPEALATLKEAIACYEHCGRSTGYEVDGYRRNLKALEDALNAHSPSSASSTPAASQLIEEIVDRELAMFLAVQNEGGPAACQQQPDNFRLMRRMAHIVHTVPTLTSILRDLQQASAVGRNLMVEKYARMDNRIPPISTSPLLDSIAAAELEALHEACRVWPEVIRPHADGGESFARYLRAELETLSDGTLELYAEELRDAKRANRNVNVERYAYFLEQIKGK